jgi:hypothetical protein
MSDTELVLQQATAIDATTDRETVLDAIAKVEFLVQAAREAKAALQPGLIEWINEHGDLEEGDLRWYVANKKRIKPRDLLDLADAVLRHTGGDLAVFTEYLSANAFKHGALRGLVGDEWDELFDVELVPDVATGKPKKEVKKVDARFVKVSK